MVTFSINILLTYLSLNLKGVSYRKLVFGNFFQSSLSISPFLMGMFSPFMWNLINNMVKFMFVILLFVVFTSHIFFFFFFPSVVLFLLSFLHLSEIYFNVPF